MQALWGEPWTARSVFVDGNEVVPFRLDVKDRWPLAKQCTVTQQFEGKARSREDENVGRPGFELVRFDAEDSIPPIGCFLGAFVHFLRTIPKEVSRSTATKVESGISDPNRGSLVRERS